MRISRLTPWAAALAAAALFAVPAAASAGQQRTTAPENPTAAASVDPYADYYASAQGKTGAH